MLKSKVLTDRARTELACTDGVQPDRVQTDEVQTDRDLGPARQRLDRQGATTDRIPTVDRQGLDRNQKHKVQAESRQTVPGLYRPLKAYTVPLKGI